VLGAGLFGTPREYLFYSGGGGTVRGQPFQSLGVESSCEGRRGGGPGCVIRTGGLSFAALSLEARLKLSGAIGAVAFADAGFVARDLFGDGDWHAGAGLGLRYDTGIGPIRLDLALPVAGKTGAGLQLYIGIGQAF
jgi:translocation and assembly module TamA